MDEYNNWKELFDSNDSVNQKLSLDLLENLSKDSYEKALEHIIYFAFKKLERHHALQYKLLEWNRFSNSNITLEPEYHEYVNSDFYISFNHSTVSMDETSGCYRGMCDRYSLLIEIILSSNKLLMIKSKNPMELNSDHQMNQNKSLDNFIITYE